MNRLARASALRLTSVPETLQSKRPIPRQLRFVAPRKPRGYWLEDGEGGKKVLALVKIYGPIPSVIARKLGERYGNLYQVGLRLRCWREDPQKRTRRDPVTAYNAMIGREPQEIDWTEAPIFKVYGRADAYASMPAHVWKAEIK